MEITDLKKLAEKLIESIQARESLEADLKAAKAEEKRLKEDVIPTAMQEAGVSELTLDSGEKIKIDQDIFFTIPEKGKEPAFFWLETHGHSGLIKIDITTHFKRRQYEEAQDFFRSLQRKMLDVSFKQDVHHQTLKAFLKNEIKKGENIPLDIFGATPVFTTKISK